MNLNVKNLLLVCVFLSGCAQTQVPYKIAKVVEHESRLLPVQFPLGITQEKLGDKEYRITAKLAELGTKERARNMALYHASILAEAQDFDAFIVNNISNASWCRSSTNNLSGGPTAKLIITLAHSKNSNNTNNLYLIKNTKDSNKMHMDYQHTEVELKQISAERLDLCRSRSNKKRMIR